MGRRGNGEGTITRRKDGRWEARYTVHSAEGPKRKVLYGKMRGAVAEKLNTALSDRSSGLTFDAVNLTVGKYLHHWLEDSVKSLVDDEKMAHSTFIRYEGIVNNHLKPALGHRKLKDLSRAEVRRLYKEKGKAFSPRSVDYIHVTLQNALSQAVRDDLIPRNVSQRGASPQQPQSERGHGPLPHSGTSALAEARGERNEAIYIAAIHTGLRKGELLGLKWTDLDLDGGTLSVRRSLKVTDHGLGFGPTKNKASRRSVPLNKSAVAALKAHRMRQNEERLRLGELWVDQDLVFPNRVGKPINPSNLYNREYKPLLKRAGLEDERFTFHSLRHTFASALCNKRVYPKVIQSLLGHSSITQTMDTYSHLMGGMGSGAVDGLDEAFGG